MNAPVETTGTTTPRRKLGILFVHGIGQQKRGDTMTRFGDALVQWLSRVLPGTRISRAVLDPDGTKDHPSFAEIGLGDEKRDTHAQLVAAEGFWADTVIPPRFSEMLRWSLQVLPWTALSFFDQLVLRAWTSWKTLKSINDRVLGIPGAVALVLSLVLALLLVPMIAMVLLLVLLLGLVPIPAVQSFAASIQRGFAATVGDSMILLASPVQRAAIIDRVHDAYRWLVDNGCNSIVIVAHSQGAAIAHEMLRTRERHRVSLFVSLGSGLRKLRETEAAMRERNPKLWIAALCALGFAVVGFGIVRYAGAVALPLQLALIGFGMAWGMLVMRGWIYVMGLVLWRRSRNKPKPNAWKFLWDLLISFGISVIASIVALIVYVVVAWILAGFLLPPESPAFVRFFVVVEAILIIVTMYSLSEWRGSRSLRATEGDGKTTLPGEYRLESLPRWVDIYAGADPVPNGPLVDGLQKEGETFESVEVENRSSMLLDHVTYWQNVEQVVTRVGCEILRLGGYDVSAYLDDEKQRQISNRRLRRMRQFRRAWLGVAITVLGAAIANWAWLTAMGRQLRLPLVSLAAQVPLVGQWIAAGFALDQEGIAIASMLALLVLLPCTAILVWTWNAWDRRASREFLDDDPDEGLFAKKLFTFLALLLMIVASACAARGLLLRIAPNLGL